MPGVDWSSLRAPLLDAARQAGGIIRDHWNKPRNISFKGPIDIVTETDVAVEDFLRERLGKILPEANFVGEESSNANYDFGEVAWVVDPLDGTTNFAQKLPFVATSIGLMVQGRMRLGVIYNPIMDELFEAEAGQGAFCNGERIAVSEKENLQHCVVATGFPYSIRQHITPVVSGVEQTLLHCRALRRYGAAALDLAYVAWGRLDVFYEAHLHPWDTAAGWLVVEEAGGRVTQLDPDTPYHLTANTLLATNGHVHESFAGKLAGIGFGD